MAQDFPLFVDIIRNVEMALAKADFGIARLYASLVEDEALRDRVFTTLKSEFDLTQKHGARGHRADRRCSRPIRCWSVRSACAILTSIR